MTEQKRLLKAAMSPFRNLSPIAKLSYDKVAVELEAAIKAEEKNMIDKDATHEAHVNGVISGLNWPDAWMDHGKPGGPWIPRKGYTDKEKAFYAQLSAENKAWRAGWEIGLAVKVATGRINPLAYIDLNAKLHARE